MAEQRHYSRVGQLLRAYGVGDRMSGSEAADRCGISRESISRLMREVPDGRTRRLRRETLDKLAAGLDIPRDLLEREMMADWGYVSSTTAEDVRAVLLQFAALSPRDQLEVQAEIIKMQQARLEE